MPAGTSSRQVSKNELVEMERTSAAAARFGSAIGADMTTETLP